ncbi:DNA repair exonuclease [Candidatus Micrarchaeota archaeon]|nr:DNA repair exonuclease [Candidatus Micrarchaeota archaeon]
MARFAHLADIHLGAFRDARLRELNLRAFEAALDLASEENVDFAIIAGDLFHINIPDLAVVERAVRKMRQFGKPIYAVYGSHDFSPTQTSIIDILHEAGVLTKVSAGAYQDGTLTLDVVQDAKTGVKITGISARKLGLEKTYFQDLDGESLEKIPGQKIFVFHCAISEHKPASLQRMDAVPLSLFPKGFDYYAGGHVHERLLVDFGSGKLAYPGPLFAADFRDLESLSKQNHGFYVVKLGGPTRFVCVDVGRVHHETVSVDGLTAQAAQEKAMAAAQKTPGADVALFEVKGTLSQGKPSEIAWNQVREALQRQSPIAYVNKHQLQAREHHAVRVHAHDPQRIAENVFRESLADRAVDDGWKGESGVKRSLQLLDALKRENPGETKARWEEKIVDDAVGVLA